MSENEIVKQVENGDDSYEEIVVTEEVFYEEQEEAEQVPEPQPAQPVAAEPEKEPLYWGTGRRKSSVARVRIRPGESHLTVNRKPMDEYFTVLRWRNEVQAPLRVTQLADRFAIDVSVKGGGPSSQAGAVSLGIARALLKYDSSLMESLRSESLLTRDSRMKERKKYGHKGARKSFQFSKR